MMSHLWERIRLARRKSGLTQTQVGEACDVSPVAVSLWETKPDHPDHTDPSLESLIAFAKVTRVPVQWFLEDAEPDPLVPIPSFWSTPPRQQPPKPITVADVQAGSEAVVIRGLHVLFDLSPVPWPRSAFVAAPDLHTALGNERSFDSWWKDRLATYPFFEENLNANRRQDPRSKDIVIDLNLEMAKSLALLEGTAQGFACWQKLIGLESRLQELALALEPVAPAVPRTAPLITTRTE